MGFVAFGGAEVGEKVIGQGLFDQTHGASSAIVNAPALVGGFSYEIDPVNGDGLTEVYGFRGWLGGGRSFLTVMGVFQWTVDFDENVSIVELVDSTGNGLSRRLILTPAEEFQIQDKDDAEIGITAGAPYVARTVAYPFLWYMDVRGTTRDVLWVWKAGAWDTAIDVTDHGEGHAVDRIFLGSGTGKGLPTVGGPFYLDEVAVQVLEGKASWEDTVGSVTTRLKLPDGDGEEDTDFTAPDWNDVKQVPHDGDTTYDVGDAAGERQTYDLEDANGGDTPMSLNIIGVARKTGTAGAVEAKPYLHDGTARDYGDESARASSYTGITGDTFGKVAFNTVNGEQITEGLFNSLEVGLEVTTLTAPDTIRLTSTGVEYLVAGPYPLPDNFPRSLPHQPGRAMRHMIVR